MNDLKYQNPTRFRLLEECAESVFNQFQGRLGEKAHPPIPVFRIVTQLLGLQIEYRDLSGLGKGIKGALSNNGLVIYVDINCSPTEKHFAIAHEIGHLVLRDLDDRSRGMIYGKKINEYSEEFLADKFACALLMPRAFVKQEIQKISIINSSAINRLTNVFKISPTRAIYRINYLRDYSDVIDKPVDEDSLNELEVALSKNKKKTKQINKVSQLTLHDVGPFYAEKSTLQSYKSIWFIQRYLTNELGCFIPYGGNGKHGRVISPAERLGGRPLVIELAGTPNAGKSTQIQPISSFLRDICGYTVKVVEEDYGRCPLNGCSYDVKFYWALGGMIQNLMEVLDKPRKYDVIIFDRLLYDALAFLRYHVKKGRIKEKEEASHAAFLLSNKFRSLVDIVFELIIPPEVAVQREHNFPGDAVSALAQKFGPHDAPKRPNHSLIRIQELKVLNECYEYVYDR